MSKKLLEKSELNFLKDKDLNIYNLKEKLNSIHDRVQGLSGTYIDQINFWG